MCMSSYIGPFMQARNAVISGVHETTFEQTVQFAALNMQITYGNYDPLIHVAGFME